MKKISLLILTLLLGFYAFAQVPALQDTVISGASTLFTPQNRYQTTSYGNLVYRYNPLNGKYALQIDSKYLRANYINNKVPGGHLLGRGDNGFLLLTDAVGNQLAPTGATVYPFMLLEPDGVTQVSLCTSSSDVVTAWNADTALSAIATIVDAGSNRFTYTLKGANVKPVGIRATYDYERTLFNETGFGTGSLNTSIWTQTLNSTTASVDGSGVLTATGGAGSFSTPSTWENINYGGTFLTDAAQYIDMYADSKDAGVTTFEGGGIYLPSATGNGAYKIVQFCMSNYLTTGLGKIFFYDGSTTQSSTLALSYTAGDLIRIKKETHNKQIILTATNLTAGGSVSLTLDEGSSLTSGFRYCVGHLGGNARYKNAVLTTKQGLYADLGIYGDSIWSGGIDPTAATFARYLTAAAFPNKRMSTFSAGSATISNFTTTYPTKANEFKYKTVILHIGTNDVLGLASTSTFSTRLSALIAQAEANGSKVILATLPPLNSIDVRPYNTVIYALAGSRQVIDIFTALATPGNYTWNAAYDSGDHVHPNSAGQVVMGNTDIAALPINNNIVPPIDTTLGQVQNLTYSGGLGINGTDLTINNVDWAKVNNRPTTLGGYGIADAAPLSGGSNYIQNQQAAAQSTSNYWISGNGKIDGQFMLGTSGAAVQSSKASINGGTGNGLTLQATNNTGFNLILQNNTYGTTLASTAAFLKRDAGGFSIFNNNISAINVDINGNTSFGKSITTVAGTSTLGSFSIPAASALLATPVAGAFEHYLNALYFTNNSGVRVMLANTSTSTFTPSVIFQTPTGTGGTDSLMVKIGSTKKLGAVPANGYYAAYASVVPYVGATTDIDIGNHALATSGAITGGVIGSLTDVYVGYLSHAYWKQSSGGLYGAISLNATLTANRFLYIPDATGTIALVPTSTQTTSGTTAPSSTPSKVGDVYVDTVAKKIYFSTGTSSSADWTIVN